MSRAIQLAVYSMMFILLAFIIACAGIGFAYEKELPGKYCIQATDTLDQMSIAKMPSDGGNLYGGVIGKTVFAVGWNDRFIIVKRHPEGDKSITEFYIIRVSDGHEGGPWAEAGFNAERKKLGVPKNLTFTLEFDGLK